MESFHKFNFESEDTVFLKEKQITKIPEVLSINPIITQEMFLSDGLVFKKGFSWLLSKEKNLYGIFLKKIE